MATKEEEFCIRCWQDTGMFQRHRCGTGCIQDHQHAYNGQDSMCWSSIKATKAEILKNFERFPR